MNNKYTSKSICLYTFPIILSELLEEVIILSDSILLSFKDPLYLSTVGVIDSIFLLFLAVGDSMNDSFQNFYSRHSGSISRCKCIFSYSLPLFIGVGLISATLCSLIPLSNGIWESAHFATIVSVVPYLSILVVLSFISLSLNSLLLGWGFTKFLGCISLISILVNIIVGYFLLYVYDIGLNPCVLVIITSSLSELLRIIFMSLKIWRIYNQNNDNDFDCRHQSSILKILVYSSVYPCLSAICFHLGSLALYTYCLCYFLDRETALFTLFMSYWGILQVPSQGFSETSINFFSNIYSEKLFNIYNRIKKRFLSLSLLTCIFLTFIIFMLDICLYGLDAHRLFVFAILISIVGLHTFAEITEASLLVRLKINSFILSKILYATILILGILLMTITNNIGIIGIFICFLFAQLFNCAYLHIIDLRIWGNRYKNKQSNCI